MADLTMFLSKNQYRGIDIATRISSVVSLLGSAFILTTFVTFPYFRKPVNRLIYLATFGNIMVNVATLIATKALPRPGDVNVHGLCEAQGIIIQWFMSADACWDLCMSLNVFLVFFLRWDSRKLHSLEIWYILFSYGVPGIPSLAYIFMNHTGHSVIGTATIWCWVNQEHDWMRFAFFYGPVWLVIIATFTVYVVTGVHIYNKASLLRDFQYATAQQTDMDFLPVGPNSGDNPFLDTNNILVTTDIELCVQGPDAAKSSSSLGDSTSMYSSSSTRNFSESGDAMGQRLTAPAQVYQTRENKASESHRALVRSTARDRLGYRAKIFSAIPRARGLMGLPRSWVSNLRANFKSHPIQKNLAIMVYLKVALLMFMAVVMVWVPSTINRAYSFIHQGEAPHFGLNITSATVLPLQGAWSAIIYSYTTRSELKRAYAEIRDWISGKKAQRQKMRLKLYDYRRKRFTRRPTPRTQIDIELDDLY